MTSSTSDTERVWFHYILTVHLAHHYDGPPIVGDDHCIELATNATEEDMLAAVVEIAFKRKGVPKGVSYAVLFYRCAPDARA